MPKQAWMVAVVGVLSLVPAVARQPKPRWNLPDPLVAASPLPNFHYTVINLGLLPGYPMTQAYGINNRGQVVGDAGPYSGIHPENRAWIWEAGKMRPLSPQPAYIHTHASGINDSGTVVGEASRDRIDSLHAVLWNSGKPQDLGTLSAGDFHSAYGINNRGQIVGSSNRLAFLWDGQAMHDLGTVGGRYAYARAINDRGQVVGSSEAANGGTHAFLWQGNKMQDLGQGEAYAINRHGQIAGFFYSHTGMRAMLWTDGRPKQLDKDDPFTEVNQSAAFGINERAQIVGRLIEDSGRNFGAFLWQHGRRYDLNDLIRFRSGWVLEEARAINDRGEIVGWGQFRGTEHAFLLRPQAGLPANTTLVVRLHPKDTPEQLIRWCRAIYNQGDTRLRTDEAFAELYFHKSASHKIRSKLNRLLAHLPPDSFDYLCVAYELAMYGIDVRKNERRIVYAFRHNAYSSTGDSNFAPEEFWSHLGNFYPRYHHRYILRTLFSSEDDGAGEEVLESTEENLFERYPQSVLRIVAEKPKYIEHLMFVLDHGAPTRYMPQLRRFTHQRDPLVARAAAACLKFLQRQQSAIKLRALATEATGRRTHPHTHTRTNPTSPAASHPP